MPLLGFQEALLVLIVFFQGVDRVLVPFGLNQDFISVPVLWEIREEDTWIESNIDKWLFDHQDRLQGNLNKLIEQSTGLLLFQIWAQSGNISDQAVCEIKTDGVELLADHIFDPPADSVKYRVKLGSDWTSRDSLCYTLFTRDGRLAKGRYFVDYAVISHPEFGVFESIEHR